MRTIVVYPGRFHPFHRGHKASYDYLVKKYGPDSVYIVTSNVQAPVTSPFSYSDKVQMMSKLDIPASHIVQVRNPYQAREIYDNIPDAENTALIYAVSEKDMQGADARFKFGAKKNGEPSYMQPLPEDPEFMQPLTKHAYVDITPTVDFQVRGANANSASEIRKLYMAGSDSDRDSIIADLYGEVYPDLRDTFDARLAQTQQVQEVVREARERNPARAVELLETIKRLESKAHHKDQLQLEEFTATAVIEENPDYLEEKWSERYKRSINCNNPKGFSQRAHCAGRKKK